MAQNIPFTPWQPFDNLPKTARTVRSVPESDAPQEDKYGSSTMVASEVRTYKPNKHDGTLMGKTLTELPNKDPPPRRAEDVPVQRSQEHLAYGQQPLGTVTLVQPVYKFNGVDRYELYAYALTMGDPETAIVADPEVRGRAGDSIITQHLKGKDVQQLESPRPVAAKSSGVRGGSRRTTTNDFNGARLICGPVDSGLLDALKDLRCVSENTVADDLRSDAGSETTTKIAYEEPLEPTGALTLIRIENEDCATTCGDYDSDATAKPVTQTRRALGRFNEYLDKPELFGLPMTTGERTIEICSDAGSSSAGEDEDYDEDDTSNGIHESVDNIGCDESASDGDDAPPHEFSYEELLPYRNTGWLHVAPYLRYPDYELQSEIRSGHGRLPESSIRGLER
ncbi:hypothetical protein BDN71DRAFT_1444354 [Pleurotus eryngii]|uniref:Uncharacterized protein n=1 Tax=Pleurotus eryngii TaxID=5323 RepID=A0A9P6A2Y3_PLEER|nr:hypothetical protein BDN71DRAFT_1444354 [Pleurotus eryngii]